MLKILKALAEYHDISLSDLLEGIVLHVFDGRLPFNDTTMRRISQLKDVYGLDLTADNAHNLTEVEP